MFIGAIGHATKISLSSHMEKDDTTMDIESHFISSLSNAVSTQWQHSTSTPLKISITKIIASPTGTHDYTTWFHKNFHKQDIFRYIMEKNTT